ncbi:uncharacterized protein LOC119557179 [Drosophila subpulchrella]|uniref:uncharacterized protein LOC119557179 n=1 Tax=Drosophila subpulchrella TaxID=1486046 RepID=UPI0018A16672|nr:uncharacterized protein LOC119557179 [Drosophila subpulchrella]
MCMPYLNKLFGGGGRNRERRNRNGGITPLPSLANVTEVSMDTVHTVKSGKSSKSVKSGKSASRRSTNTNAGQPPESSVSSMESNTERSLAAASKGAVRNTTASAAPSVAPADGSRSRRSWWGYFGMNKNKKPSIESL